MMEISFRTVLKILGILLLVIDALFILIDFNITLAILSYMALVGYFLNRRLFCLERFDSVMLTPLVVSMLTSVLMAPVLYFWQLTTLELVYIASVPAILLLVFRKSTVRLATARAPRVSLRTAPAIFCALSLALSLATLIILFSSQTRQTTLGPWDVVPPIFFIVVCINFCVLITAGKLNASFRMFVPVASAFFFSIVSVLAIVYPLGFGFDPLVHRAAEQVIIDQGTLTPKTPYYLGHYGLVAALAKLFGGWSELFDRFVVAGIAALALPLLFTRVLNVRPLKIKSALTATALIFTLIPFSPIASGTPWGHAYFLALVAILASVLFWSEKNNGWRRFAFLASCALFAVHPLAGLPMIGFFMLLFFSKISRAACAASLLISAASVPIAFLALSLVLRSSQLSIVFTPFNADALRSFFLPFVPRWEWRFHVFADPAYLYANNIDVLLALGAIGGLAAARTFLPDMRNALYRTLFGFAGAMLSFIATKGFISFPSLPLYEQATYSDRIKEISLLFLFVLCACALAVCVHMIGTRARRYLIFVSILFFAVLGIVNLYASYPRNDPYIPYHGHTVSDSDINAVHWINDTAAGKKYIVLSNQVTAVASIKEFGFAAYIPISSGTSSSLAFYYSIPASSPLHEAFVSMLTAPSHEIISAAKMLTNAEYVYFVVHSYEPRFRNVIDKTKKIAGTWRSWNNEEITVFQF